MSQVNLGRVQGGGFFGSTSESETAIDKSTVLTVDGITPLVGDTIVNSKGSLCRILSMSAATFAVQKYGSIKGADGESGGLSAFAFLSDTADFAVGYTKGGAIDRELKEIKMRLAALEGGN